MSMRPGRITSPGLPGAPAGSTPVIMPSSTVTTASARPAVGTAPRISTHQGCPIATAAPAAALGLGIGSAVWATSSASAAPSAPSALAAIPPVCTSGNLAVWVDRDGPNGAAGTISYPLEFTNVSNHTCRTWGYPGVSATGSNGQQLGSAAARNPLYP